MKLIILFLSLILISSCSSDVVIQKDISSIQFIEDMTALYQQKFSNFQEDIYSKTPDEVTLLKNSHTQVLQEISQEYQNIVKVLPKYTGKITYLDAPVVMENLWFFKNSHDRSQFKNNIVPENWEYTENTGSYIHVGNLEFSNGKIGKLFYVTVDAFYSHSPTFYFMEYEGEYYAIPSISISANEETDIEQILTLQKWLIWKNIHLFEEARFTDIFAKDFTLISSIPFTKNDKKYTLSLKKRVSTPFSLANLRKIEGIMDEFGRSFYIENSGSKQWFDTEFQELEKLRIGTMSGYELYEKIDPIRKDRHEKRLEQQWLFESDALFLEMPDHTTAIYQIEVPFLEQSEYNDSYWESLIRLKNGNDTRILKNFSYQDPQSCRTQDGTYLYVPDGRFRFEEMRVISMMELQDPKKWKGRLPQDLARDEYEFHYQESDLVSIGSTGSGESLLFFKDRNHPFLHALYEYGYKSGFDRWDCLNDPDRECPKILSFSEYTKTIPVFFWRDPFDRLILFIWFDTIQPSACGAKPVIYLYPPAKITVKVTLDWNKKQLISIPEYSNGWSVTAYPDGKLDIGGMIYPYLFWEDTIRYAKPTSGFVIAQADVPSFLSEKLSFLGLNTQEIADFREYWIPHMQDALYYRISFLTNETMDQSAPITITPKPDSIRRIFMDFTELQKPIQIPEQQLTPFVRSGFSVIEWGGKKQ